MSTIICSEDHFIGQRPVYEDRGLTAHVKTMSGLDLDIAVVADGVGGEDKGERAAQIAVETVLRAIETATERDVPTILRNAVRAANNLVYKEVMKTRANMSCTLAIAAILDGTTLYIANVGDSRIYLCRHSKNRDRLTQLTIDHTVANVIPWSGKISPEEALRRDDAHMLMRALGIKPNIEVDIGFYVGTTDPQEAEQRGEHGLPLNPSGSRGGERVIGDVILVCTDGLIKRAPDGTPFTTEDEIIRTLRDQEGNHAARELTSYARGRNADDNVTVELLQTPDPNRQRRRWIQRGTLTFIAAAAMIVIVFLGMAFLNSRQQIGENVQTITAVAFVQTGIKLTVDSYTRTPTPTLTETPTPHPTLIAGQVGMQYPNDVSDVKGIALKERTTIESGGSYYRVFLNHDTVRIHDDARLYVQPATRLQVYSVSNAGIELSLDKGGDVFIQTGDYSSGTDIELMQDSRAVFSVSGSCMSVSYVPGQTDMLSVNCYEGLCSYSKNGNSGNKISIPQGQQVLFSVQDLTAKKVQPISQNDALRYRDILFKSMAGQNDAAKCLNPYLPTPTPMPTATRIYVPPPTKPSVPNPQP